MDNAVEMVIQHVTSRFLIYLMSISTIIFWWRSRSKCIKIKRSPERKADTARLERDIDPYMGYSETLLMEIYEAAYKSSQEYYADRCLELIQIYPRYINQTVKDSLSTPFLAACRAGNPNLVEYMLRHGADITACTSAGESPLYLAAYNAAQSREEWNPTLLNLLYEAGCQQIPHKLNGFNVLHLASSYGHISLVRWLLLHGANPEEATICGETPLMLARCNLHVDVYELLSQHIRDRKKARMMWRINKNFQNCML